jgi:hypothetical protein
MKPRTYAVAIGAAMLYWFTISAGMGWARGGSLFRLLLPSLLLSCVLDAVAGWYLWRKAGDRLGDDFGDLALLTIGNLACLFFIGLGSVWILIGLLGAFVSGFSLWEKLRQLDAHMSPMVELAEMTKGGPMTPHSFGYLLVWVFAGVLSGLWVWWPFLDRADRWEAPPVLKKAVVRTTQRRKGWGEAAKNA